MKIVLGGVRGTAPVARADFLTFGGNTTSVLVQGEEGNSIMIDAGTGLRALGYRLEQADSPFSLLLLMTHYHLDHIMGLPSLSLLYRKEWSVQMAAPIREGVQVDQVVSRILAKPFWPVQWNQLQANLTFVTLPAMTSCAPWAQQPLQVRWCSVHHPEGCTAFRIDEPMTNRAIVFATDVEWQESAPDEKEAFLKLCREPAPPDILFFDGQFTPQQYPLFKDWGHSSWNDAVEVSKAVGARRLMIIHHAPAHNDQILEKIECDVKSVLPNAELARESVELDLQAKSNNHG